MQCYEDLFGLKYQNVYLLTNQMQLPLPPAVPESLVSYKKNTHNKSKETSIFNKQHSFILFYVWNYIHNMCITVGNKSCFISMLGYHIIFILFKKIGTGIQYTGTLPKNTYDVILFQTFTFEKVRRNHTIKQLKKYRENLLSAF